MVEFLNGDTDYAKKKVVYFLMLNLQPITHQLQTSLYNFRYSRNKRRYYYVQVINITTQMLYKKES